MSVVVITPPEPVVTWADAKAHLRLDTEDEKVYVESLIMAATAWIDGPAGWLGRAIGVQLLEYRDDAPCSPVVQFPFPPAVEVVEVWSGSDALPIDQHQHGALSIGLGFGVSRSAPLRIRYWAGYGRRDPDDPTKWINEAPAPVKVAILLLVAQWHATRENVVTGTITSQMPFAVEALLQPYRVYR